MSQNFPNFPKGPNFREIFDYMGDGIFNSDAEPWRSQRKVAQTLLNHHSFQQFSKATNQEKLQNGLVPVLDHLCAHGLAADLEDLMQRFTSDVMITLTNIYDPKSLSADVDLHNVVPYMKAMYDVERTIIYRQIFPKCLWKFARWLNIGPERELSEARRVLDHTIAGFVSRKRQELGLIDHGDGEKHKEGAHVDLLTSYIESGLNQDKFLRDTVMTYLFVGLARTSVNLSWFFWLVYNNPSAKIKIREELANVGTGSDKLVYLHGALCETLRLYPAIPFEYKSPIEADILPSGHRMDPKSTIVFSLYAMGRMRSIWRDDCLEFKPERWISEKGKIKHEPSYKFLAFNAGPRICIGKNFAFAQMKMVAAAIIHNYDIEVVEGHDQIMPCLSIILHMKNGLIVKVSKRQS